MRSSQSRQIALFADAVNEENGLITKNLFFVEENPMDHRYWSKSSKWFPRLTMIILLLFAMFAVDLPVLAKDNANGTAEQKTALSLESLRDHPGVALRLPEADAQGRRSPQPSFRGRLC